MKKNLAVSLLSCGLIACGVLAAYAAASGDQALGENYQALSKTIAEAAAPQAGSLVLKCSERAAGRGPIAIPNIVMSLPDTTLDAQGSGTFSHSEPDVTINATVSGGSFLSVELTDTKTGVVAISRSNSGSTSVTILGVPFIRPNSDKVQEGTTVDCSIGN